MLAYKDGWKLSKKLMLMEKLLFLGIRPPILSVLLNKGLSSVWIVGAWRTDV